MENVSIGANVNAFGDSSIKYNIGRYLHCISYSKYMHTLCFVFDFIKLIKSFYNAIFMMTMN